MSNMRVSIPSVSVKTEKLHGPAESSLKQIADEGTLGILESIMDDCIKHLSANKQQEEQRNALGEAFKSVFFLGRLSASSPRSTR